MRVRGLIDRHARPLLARGFASLGAAFARERRAMERRGLEERTQSEEALEAVRASDGERHASDAVLDQALEAKEDEVRAQASRHKTIFQGTPVMMGAIDGTYRIVDVSAFCLAELGYDRSEVVGRRIADFVAPSVRGQTAAKLLSRAVRDGDARRDLGLRILRKDGSAMEVLFSTAPEYDEDGTIARHWWVMKDVTERNAVIGELRRREQLYSGVFNQTFQFVALITPEGVVKEANRTLASYTGRPPQELAGAPIWQLPGWSIDPDGAARLESALARAALGDFVQDELRVAGAAGEIATIDFTLKPLRSEAGEVEVVIFEGRDVTAQRRQQEELHHASRMEAMGALTSGVAHDFNNLLSVIAGNLELAEALAEIDPRVHERIDNAIGAVFRGQTLTRQLLAFSRKQSLQPASVAANDLIRSMEQIVETLGEQIRIEPDLADDLWSVWADRAQLETALLNVAINARDAMPEGGRIEIATRNVHAADLQHIDRRQLDPGDYVEIRVTDTGHGMSPEVLEHALDPFFTTKPVGRGTGLGLSTAHGFARQSGGTLEIASERGRGTTIRIYLPRSDADRTGPDDERPPPAGARDLERQILLLEDDEDVREMTAAFLRRAGYGVEEAADADEAVALLRSGRRYDVLFSDIVVTGARDGYDVAQFARDTRPDVGILLCSGYPGRARRPPGFDAARDCEFVEKPYRHDEVLRRIERILPQRSS